MPAHQEHHLKHELPSHRMSQVNSSGRTRKIKGDVYVRHTHTHTHTQNMTVKFEGKKKGKRRKLKKKERKKKKTKKKSYKPNF